MLNLSDNRQEPYRLKSAVQGFRGNQRGEPEAREGIPAFYQLYFRSKLSVGANNFRDCLHIT